MNIHATALVKIFTCILCCSACMLVHVRVSDVFKQDFLTVISCRLGAGLLNLSPGRAASILTAEPSLQFHSTTFLKPTHLQAEVSDGHSLSRKLMMVLDCT